MVAPSTPLSCHGGLILTSGQLLTTGQFFDHWSNVWDPPESVWGEIISIDGQTQLLVKFDYWSIFLTSGQITGDPPKSVYGE